MRIAQVACAFPPYSGGIGNSAQQIAKLLADNHEIINFTPQHLQPWLRYGHGAFLPQLFWKLKKFNYIYLHYPFFGTAEIIWLIKKFRPNIKLIIHYHMDVIQKNYLSKLLSLPSRLIRSALLNQADIIVSASLDYIQSSQIKKYYTQHSEKFIEIPFGIDLELFQPKPINHTAPNALFAKTAALINYVNQKFIKKNRLNFIFIGALDQAHYFKGIDLLLPSLAAINSTNWRLTIIGDGDLRASYEQLSQHHNLNRQVTFTGKLNQTELIRALQEADLLILPSINRNEAFGLVLIEALACGVPVMASNLPGVRSVFTDSQQGFLIEPNNHLDLQNKLTLIIKNPHLLTPLSRAARRLAEKKYSLSQMQNRLNSLFK